MCGRRGWWLYIYCWMSWGMVDRICRSCNLLIVQDFTCSRESEDRQVQIQNGNSQSESQFLSPKILSGLIVPPFYISSWGGKSSDWGKDSIWFFGHYRQGFYLILRPLSARILSKPAAKPAAKRGEFCSDSTVDSVLFLWILSPNEAEWRGILVSFCLCPPFSEKVGV